MSTCLLKSWIDRNPAKTAYIFLADGERDERSLTYAELDRRARAIAARLQERIRPGDRVLLLFPSGLEFVEAFFGCLYAGAVAVPAYPPDPAAPRRVLGRIEAIAADCRPAAVLTVRSLADARGDLAEHAPSLARIPLYATDEAGAPNAWRPPELEADDVAFLQYTSGSTASPKGVMVTYENLAANEAMLQATFAQDADATIVSWLPLFHDMGLIGVVLYTAFLGARCVFMSPQHFLARPQRWLEAVDRHRATYTGAPNFGFELCLRKVSAEDRARLDLSSVRVVFNGAEPVRPDTVDRFGAVFAECGLDPAAICPSYGLAEATLIVSGSPAGAAPRSHRFDDDGLERGVAEPGDGRPMQGCGPPAGEQEVMIVLPDTGRPVDAGAVGEIWVAGPNVAAGYWGRPEESDATFRARTDPDDERRYLRTGDLGFLHDGEVHVVGRLKDLVIVRGRNLAPQDLERAIEEAHPGLRPGCGAVFQEPANGRLVVVQEADPARCASPEEAIGAAREAVLRDFEVELDAVVLVAPRTIPKTSSGKIQRRACRSAYERGRLDVVARWAAGDAERAERVEAAVTRLVAGRTGLDPSGVGPGDAIGDLGVDSLAAARRARRARRAGHAPAWEPLPVQYADYTLWQRELLADDADPDSAFGAQAAYWRRQLDGLPERLPLPTDRPRPPEPSGRLDFVDVALDAPLHAALTDLARRSNATVFMVLQAVLAALLTGLGAGTDIPIGVPVAGRTDEALDDLIGCFVNTLVLRTDTSGDPTYAELIARVRDTNLAAYTNQDVPFEYLADALDPSPPAGRHPSTRWPSRSRTRRARASACRASGRGYVPSPYRPALAGVPVRAAARPGSTSPSTSSRATTPTARRSASSAARSTPRSCSTGPRSSASWPAGLALCGPPRPIRPTDSRREEPRDQPVR